MIINIVFFLISIIILAIIYIILRQRIDKLTDTKRLSNALAGDLDIILAEINQATERNIIIIEDKIKELDKIIETAEKRIVLLKKSVPAKPAARALTQLALEIPSEKDKGQPNSGELSYSHLNRMSSMAGMITPLSITEKKPPESEKIQDQVLTLHKKGIDASLIASNIGVNRGEVELIISLYKQTNGGLD